MSIKITSKSLSDTVNPNEGQIEIFADSENGNHLTMITSDGTVYDLTKTSESNIESNIIEKTYLELTTAISNSELEPGQLYLMSDFQTVYDQPDYSDANTPKGVVETKTAEVDPIILLAISKTEFAKEVWRPSTPKHTLEYDINFSHTEVMGEPAKGRITYCKDEFDNETHYDHTVVLLKRYEIMISGSGIFNSFWDTGFGSTEVLTFGASSVSNKIGDNYYKLAGGFAVSNNVLGAGSLGNIIGEASNNNTFGNNIRGNTLGGYVNGNIFGNNIRYNTFGNSADFNTFGNNIGNNTFGNNTSDNTFRDSIGGNTFGDYTEGNTFWTTTENNTFGNGTSNNTFGVNTNKNTFGNDTSNNTFGGNTNNNTFGNNTSDNTFGDGTSNNIFGNNTSDNTFGFSTSGNIFGNGTSDNTFGNLIYHNTFGNSTYNNTFGNTTYKYTRYNTFGYGIKNVDFTITPAATHIYANYHCNIFKRQDETVRLSYYDNTDALVIVNPTA